MAKAMGGMRAGASKRPSKMVFPGKFTLAKIFAGNMVNSRVNNTAPKEYVQEASKLTPISFLCNQKNMKLRRSYSAGTTSGKDQEEETA